MNPSHLSDQELDKIVDALETLRLAARDNMVFFDSIRAAVNVLDNADVFAEIDTEYHDRYYRERLSK